MFASMVVDAIFCVILSSNCLKSYELKMTDMLILTVFTASKFNNIVTLLKLSPTSSSSALNLHQNQTLSADQGILRGDLLW